MYPGGREGSRMTAARDALQTPPDGVVRLWRPGVVEYDVALAWQRARSEALAAGVEGESIALLEHPPVYTLGARGNREHLLTTPDALAARGASVVSTDRGGDITFHGPGQLVAYPILNVRGRSLGAATYVRRLEAVIIDTLDAFGIVAARVEGRPGVWVDDAKIAAIGVRITRGISRHGLALNVSTDLAWFGAIVACGIPDAEVTSMDRLLGGAPPMRVVEDAMARAFERAFGARLVEEGDSPVAAPTVEEVAYAG